MWIDFPEDNNCTLVAVDKHGAMTLKEIALRHDISIVRVKQIVDQTLAKIKSVVSSAGY
jgi:DNA-directed RNA polymerase specialized sigma subunit